MFWSADDDRMKWLSNLNNYNLASFISKALEKKYQQRLFNIVWFLCCHSLVILFDQCMYVSLAFCFSLFVPGVLSTLWAFLCIKQ